MTHLHFHIPRYVVSSSFILLERNDPASVTETGGSKYYTRAEGIKDGVGIIETNFEEALWSWNSELREWVTIPLVKLFSLVSSGQWSHWDFANSSRQPQSDRPVVTSIFHYAHQQLFVASPCDSNLLESNFCAGHEEFSPKLFFKKMKGRICGRKASMCQIYKDNKKCPNLETQITWFMRRNYEIPIFIFNEVNI